jgi:poly-gamma-glutamate capsule biosynthesis protein CapA/YwtB (metallophosphatase superfamily)
VETEDPGDYFDGFVYTGVPRFNYRPELAKALRNSGVDFVSTANNHAFDRCEVGVKRTIDSLNIAGLTHAGTRQNTSEPFHEITKARGFSVAWIS